MISEETFLRKCQTAAQIQQYLFMAVRILKEFFCTRRISTMSFICAKRTWATLKLSMIFIGSAHVNIERHARVFLQC